LPIDEKHTYPREYLDNNIAILLGGRAAEEIVCMILQPEQAMILSGQPILPEKWFVNGE